MKKYFLFFLLAFFMLKASAQKTLDLNSIRDWNLVVADDAIASEKFAAQEFRDLFEKATGIKLAVSGKPAASKNIYISYSEMMRHSDAGFEIKDLDREGLRIKVSPQNIAIAGGRPRGTLYGVYEFAEKYMGVRFLAYDYTYIPPLREHLLIPYGEFTYKPPFVYRSVYYKENMDHPDFSVKLRNNAFAKDDKYGGTCDMQFIVHSFYRQCPTEKYGKEHPEYFAEVGGKRLLETYGGGPQVDVSNPEVIKVMSDAVIKEISEHPEYKNVSVVQNDNQYYCRCAKCEAINSKEQSPMGAHLAMVNAIADDVLRKYPDVKVGTLAYQYTRKPPQTIMPRDNVMVQLCSIECDLLHAYNQPDNTMNKPFADDLSGWGKICKNLWIWDYIVDFYKYGMPFPNLHSIGSNIRYYRDNNVKGVFMEANYNCVAGEMSDVKNYITSRCLWNPDLDSWELTKEFCDLYYKKSSKPIFEYLTWMHDNIDAKHLQARFNARPADVGLTAENSEWILSKFDEAMKLADDDAVRNRVERASLCAYVAILESSQGELLYKNGKASYHSTPKFKEVMSTFTALAKKHKMMYYMEDDNAVMDTVEKEFKNELDVYTKGGRPAVQFENRDWRFTLLNEENGKCIEMRNKHDNNNLLSADINDLTNGYFTETLVKGKQPGDTVKFKASVSKNELKLTSSLKDSTGYDRTLTFAEEGNGKILCKSTLTNKSGVNKTYRLKTNIYTNTGIRVRDTSIIRAAVKYNGKYAQFNAGLLGSHGPDEGLLTSGKDGGRMLLFNTNLKSGYLESYNPADVEGIEASWTDGGSYVNYGVKTKEVTLKPGESFTFDYEIKYLNAMPGIE